MIPDENSIPQEGKKSNGNGSMYVKYTAGGPRR